MATGKYWETEVPLVIDLGKNVLSYYSKAQKLRVSMPGWFDANGQQQRGRSVTLDLAAVRGNAMARDLFAMIGGVGE